MEAKGSDVQSTDFMKVERKKGLLRWFAIAYVPIQVIALAIHAVNAELAATYLLVSVGFLVIGFSFSLFFFRRSLGKDAHLSYAYVEEDSEFTMLDGIALAGAIGWLCATVALPIYFEP